jgi:hypothetical protein
MALTLFSSKDEHRSETEYALTILSHYWKISQAAVDAAEQAARKEFNAAVADVADNEARSYYATDFLTHARRYREDLPQRISYGFVLQLYGILETRARALCQELTKRRPELPLCLDELSGGKNMRGVFIYLRRLLKLTVPKQAALDHLRVIRNCIAHANGKVVDCENLKQVAKAVRASKGVTVDGEGYLVLRPIFCEESLQTVSDFFESIFNQVGFSAAGISFSRLATRHGVSCEHRDGKWTYDILEETEVKKLLETKI